MIRKILGPPGTGKTTKLLHYVRTVHCKNVEHVNDQRKRRNAISKYAGFHHL